jgi:hypothetical protein
MLIHDVRQRSVTLGGLAFDTGWQAKGKRSGQPDLFAQRSKAGTVRTMAFAVEPDNDKPISVREIRLSVPRLGRN